MRRLFRHVKENSEGVQHKSVLGIRCSSIWYWVVVVGIFLLSVGITNLVRSNDTAISEDTNQSTQTDADNPAVESELQPADRPSDDASVDGDYVTKFERQQFLDDLRKGNLDTRAASIDWWLTVIALVLGFFAIVIAIFGFLGFTGFRRYRDEAMAHRNAAKNLRNEVQNLRNDAMTHVDEFRNLRNEATGHRDEVVRLRNEFQALKNEAETDVNEFQNLRDEFQSHRDEAMGFRDDAMTHVGEFRNLRNEAMGHRDEVVRLRGEFQALKNEAETDVNEFQNLRDEFQSHRDEAMGFRDDAVGFRDQAREYASEMQDYITAFRARWEEFEQVMRAASERLDPEIIAALSNEPEFAEGLRDLQQNPEVSALDRAMLDAVALQEESRIEESIEKWRSIINIVEGIDDNLGARAWGSIGYLRLRQENIDEALSAFNNAIRFRSTYADAYVGRGNVNSLLEAYEPAIADYSLAIELGVDSAEVYSRRANAYNGLGEYDKAIADCNKAIDINSNYTEVYIVRGEAKIGLVSTDEARADLQIALGLATQQGQTGLRDIIEQRLQELDDIDNGL